MEVVNDTFDTEHSFCYMAPMPTGYSTSRLVERLNRLTDIQYEATYIRRKRAHRLSNSVSPCGLLHCLARQASAVLPDDSMGIDLSRYEDLTRQAVAEFWRTLDAQGEKQKTTDADRGERAAVTGGKQMTDFARL